MAWKGKDCSLPPASLLLLVPPVRLMSAFMWQLVQQHSVLQYDKLLDFISLVTDIVPELLSPGRRAQLILGLRARLVLELCRGDTVANLPTIQKHLDKIHMCSSEVSSTDHVCADILKTSNANFASLIQRLLSAPFEKELFFQKVFPVNYGPSYDQRLQRLVSDFLTRLEQLLPVPDLQQTVLWFTETSTVSEEIGLNLSEPQALKMLLQAHRQLGTLSSAPPSCEEDTLLSTLALPLTTVVEMFSEPYCKYEDYVTTEEVLPLVDLEEESIQSSEVTADEWLPKRESGCLSRLFVCPQCSFVHRSKNKTLEHIQSEHSLKASSQKKGSTKNMAVNTTKKNKHVKNMKTKPEKTRICKQKSSAVKRKNSESKEQPRRKEPTGVDKRFLSSRPVTRNKEETKCLNCEKVFKHPNQLEAHKRIHGFPYHCSLCEKGFTSKSGYYQHQTLHKSGRKFICSWCHKGFLSRHALRQHERLHEGPSHLCPVCGKNFSKAGITRHMQMHRGERNYLCTTCGKSFLSSGELLLHTRSHTGEMPYTCGHCGKGFSCKSHLVVHTRSHTGERPYLCSECPKRFLTLNCLKRHAFSHNGLKPFKCPSCHREFSQQGNLKRHVATHKPDT